MHQRYLNRDAMHHQRYLNAMSQERKEGDVACKCMSQERKEVGDLTMQRQMLARSSVEIPYLHMHDRHPHYHWSPLVSIVMRHTTMHHWLHENARKDHR